jgi:hypothetical protein
MHKNIILLEFEYGIGDLVEIRPGFNQFPEVLDYEDPTSFLGLILKANVKYIPFRENYNWDEPFWIKLAQRQMMSYNALVRSKIIEITEYNIIRLVNRATI